MRRSFIAGLAVVALLIAAYLFWPASPENPIEAPPAAAVLLPPVLERALASTEPTPSLAAKPRSSTTAPTTTLFGFVRDEEARPISNATVRALPKRRGEALVAQTGADGEYVLLSVPVALDDIEVSATGYRTSTIAASGLTSPRARLDFLLAAAPGIRGQVRCSGDPAVGARVFARVKGQRRHGRGLVGTGKTGPDGRFLIELEEGLPDAPIEVGAWSGTCGEGTVDYDGAPVAIELEGGGTVSGQVVDAKTKRPIPSFWISATSLLRDAGGPPAVAVDDERGAFTLGPLAPGPQRIYVAGSGYQPASRELTVRPNETASDVVIELSRSTELRGRVVDARTGRPIEGASVVPAEWTAEVLSDAVGAITGTDGRYVLTTLPDKRTSVTATARGYRSLMHGGVNGRSTKPTTLDFALTPIDGAAGEGDANELVGIGAQLRMTDVGVEVAGLVPRGPAESKLQVGDVIVQVDDQMVKDIDLGDVVQAIRGEAGTDVVVWVQRAGAREPQRVSFERARVSFSSPRN